MQTRIKSSECLITENSGAEDEQSHRFYQGIHRQQEIFKSDGQQDLLELRSYLERHEQELLPALPGRSPSTERF
jgi:hypothetical protein